MALTDEQQKHADFLLSRRSSYLALKKTEHTVELVPRYTALAKEVGCDPFEIKEYKDEHFGSVTMDKKKAEDAYAMIMSKAEIRNDEIRDVPARHDRYKNIAESYRDKRRRDSSVPEEWTTEAYWEDFMKKLDVHKI